MRLIAVQDLPDGALAAAAEFYAKVVPQFDPPRNGEVAARSADGGGGAPNASSRNGDSPLNHPAGGPPPRTGEDILFLFPPADHTHRAWRQAAVEQLARDFAPCRVNAVASDSAAAIAAAQAYLSKAPGLTGQVLVLDDAGAGPVVSG